MDKERLARMQWADEIDQADRSPDEIEELIAEMQEPIKIGNGQEKHDMNSSHDLGKHNVTNNGPTQGQVVGEHNFITMNFGSGQEEHKSPLQSSSKTKPVGSHPKRPITVFLSYNEQNTDEVAILERELKLRGMDIKVSPTKRDITYAIAHDVDALLIYATRESLDSPLIWNTTIPAGRERYESDHSFSIIIVLRGVTPTKLEHICASHGVHSLNEFYSGPLPDPQVDQIVFHEECRKVANQALKAALKLRLRHIQADDDYKPSICLRTFKDRPITPYPDLDLDLNWHGHFLDKSRLPPQTEWQEMFFPALLDVKHALGELPTNHQLHISLQCTIPAAFALGYMFRGTTSFTLLPWNKETEMEWSSASPISLSDPLRCTSDTNENGDPHVAIIEIAIAQQTALGVSNTLPRLGLSYRHHLQFALPDGPHHKTGVKNASHAISIADQIGAYFRNLCGKGVHQIHLFAALPVALAVLIGHQLNAICPVTVYEYGAGTYRPACTLQTH